MDSDVLTREAAAERPSAFPSIEASGSSGSEPHRSANPELRRLVSAEASRALLREALLAPKPGLVDRHGPGSHRDMDILSLSDSVSAISPYFGEMAELAWSEASDRAGAEPGPEILSFLFEELKSLGVKAEAAMLEATGGVNTHKGAIFSLGLLSAALGILAAQAEGKRTGANPGGRPPHSGHAADPPDPGQSRSLFPEAAPDPERLCGIAASLAARHRRGPLADRPAVSEAAAGFPSLRARSLSFLRSAAAAGAPFEASARTALLMLMADCEDSCLMKRGGPKGLALVRDGAEKLLREYGDMLGFETKALAAFASELERESLSPGGAADLLAVGIFLVGLEYPRWR